jgi:transcriptional regulator with XRE-family HTH domain
VELADTDVEEDNEELDPIIQVFIKERLARGWTQGEVGHKLGHTAGSTISQWERGHVVPSLQNTRAWGAVFELEIVTHRPVRRGRPRKLV